jgi:NAD(P)H-hydrate repair Nnr-like enzyme with NAD(P)H-hydrate epimerase domain
MTFIQWREEFRPELRRESPTGITKSTGCQVVVDCLCGASCSYCPKWPVTKRFRDFVRKHDLTCLPLDEMMGPPAPRR